MTVAVALKVRDGIVLAADSATTLMAPDGSAANHNVYNHANKIVNLCKGTPIGFMTWGIGGFGSANVAMLAKDFRANKWQPHFAAGYEVRAVAEELARFFQGLAQGVSGPFGFLVAGHTPGAQLGEAWVVNLNDGVWSDPEEVLPGEQGIVWFGQVEWLQRLLLGFDFPKVAAALTEDVGLPVDELDQAIRALQLRTEAVFIHPAMPIQDVVNLGGFLVEVTKGSVAFAPGPLTVGGPTEIAAITKHEGFKWVTRKHYYDVALNP